MPIDVPCSFPGLSSGRTYIYPVCSEWGTPETVEQVEDLFTTRSAADVAAKRAALVAHLWDGPAPTSGVSSRESISDSRFDSVGADVLERLTVDMPLSADSKMYLLRHNVRPSRLVVYVHQHGGSVAFVSAPDSLPTLRRWYQAGCDVLGIALPSLGDNDPPTHNGNTLSNHNQYWAIEEDASIGWSPVRFFAEPVVRALNELAADYDRTVICGLSGGGWTAHLCAALDERIQASYPVAGSLPWYLRQAGTSDEGDYEQQSKSLLDVANYLDWYVMACSAGRTQVQLLNRHDACCFSSMPTYADAVREAVAISGGGAWDFEIDHTHGRHAASAVGMATLLGREGLGPL